MSLVNREVTVDTVELIDSDEKIPTKSKKSIFFYIKIIFILFVVSSLGLSIIAGMYTGSHQLTVDNPTGSGVTIQIDNQQEIFITAYTTTSVELKNGEYSLKVNDYDMGSFEKTGYSSKSFLNPTNDIYIQEYVLYGDEDEDNYDKIPYNVIEAYDNYAEGPFKQYEGIYISGDWNYNIDESFPEEVSMRQSQTYKIKSKLYRFNDFVDMYNRDYFDESYVESENLDEVSEEEVINK